MNKMLSLADLGVLLHKSPKTIKRIVIKTKIPYVKVGRTMMFSESVIAEWLKSELVETPLEVPLEAHLETPVDTLAETPVETPVETPIESPVESPVESPIIEFGVEQFWQAVNADSKLKQDLYDAIKDGSLEKGIDEIKESMVTATVMLSCAELLVGHPELAKDLVGTIECGNQKRNEDE